MRYVVTRIACRNPQINGRKLYLSDIGLWTLDLANARRFSSEADAELASDLDTKTEAVPS